MPVVGSLFIYPLKSARGVEVERMELDERGAVGDRRWMIIGEDSTYISLRDWPVMALLQAHLTSTGIRLTAPGRESIDVHRPDNGARDERFRVRLWDGACDVVAADPQANAWLSDFLRTPCRLVFQPDDSVLPLPSNNTGRITEERRIALTDGAPLLLASESSLLDLNSRLASPVPMSRFRPNIVVRGSDAFEEDRWRSIVIGDVEFETPRSCPRCAATTVDQSTGTKGVEPLRTLATYRRGVDGVLFAQNITHRTTGVLRIGDAVRVLDRGPSPLQ